MTTLLALLIVLGSTLGVTHEQAQVPRSGDVAGSAASLAATSVLARASSQRRDGAGGSGGAGLPAEAAGSVGSVLVSGQANFANPSHGSDYLAMRLPRGTVVTICGAGGCWHNAVVNDYGPVEATGDIADIALVQFAKVCGWTIAEAKQRGECLVEVEYGGPRVTPPATDTGWWTFPGGGPR